jgi:hypothetical protein
LLSKEERDPKLLSYYNHGCVRPNSGRAGQSGSGPALHDRWTFALSSRVIMRQFSVGAWAIN